MTLKFKIEAPKIPTRLESANFQDVYYEEDPFLSNCTIENARLDHEEIDQLVLSKIVF
ncbi:hypothetical protein ACQKFO_05180 [Rossellomorea sp. NPDC071047]|uniref:hypothetical protein n=1 Tax=Rossellomorea sp. NPDC071047 TaxID=3390675 RepID=UPI003CFFD9DE